MEQSNLTNQSPTPQQPQRKSKKWLWIVLGIFILSSVYYGFTYYKHKKEGYLGKGLTNFAWSKDGDKLYYSKGGKYYTYNTLNGKTVRENNAPQDVYLDINSQTKTSGFPLSGIASGDGLYSANRITKMGEGRGDLLGFTFIEKSTSKEYPYYFKDTPLDKFGGLVLLNANQAVFQGDNHTFWRLSLPDLKLTQIEYDNSQIKAYGPTNLSPNLKYFITEGGSGDFMSAWSVDYPAYIYSIEK